MHTGFFREINFSQEKNQSLWGKSLQLPHANEAKFSPKYGLSSRKGPPRPDILGTASINFARFGCMRKTSITK